MPDEQPPLSAHQEEVSRLARRLRSYAALVAAVAALLASVKALAKPTDNRPVKASFETLSEEIRKLADTQAKQHDDIVALQAYIQGYIKAQEEASATVRTPPLPATSASSTTVIVSVKPAKAPPAPKLSAKPKPWNPPTFDRVLAMAMANEPVVVDTPVPMPAITLAPEPQFPVAGAPTAAPIPTPAASSAPPAPASASAEPAGPPPPTAPSASAP
jgi:hypothetical protein